MGHYKRFLTGHMQVSTLISLDVGCQLPFESHSSVILILDVLMGPAQNSYPPF